METNAQTECDLIEQELEHGVYQDNIVHPWRRCPMGKHFVREHVLHIPPSKKHPNGTTTTVHDHCADNPSHKEELSYDEIQYITKTYFANLPGPPTAGRLTVVFPTADNYDNEIRGWVKYWNDIFNSEDPLDPDYVKALIGTESSFEIKPKGTSNAHGLMQLLPETFGILRDTKGELKNHLIRISRAEYLNPSANICSGVRWIFQKKKLASAKLKRTAAWEEAIIEYKGYWAEIKKGIDPDPMQRLRKFYRILQGK